MADPKPPQMPPASYFNHMQVSHNQNEFFFHFGQLSTQQPGVAHLLQAMVTSPTHAKAMFKALRDNIEKYESKHGEICEPITSATETRGTA
jgi:hypothetical protein